METIALKSIFQKKADALKNELLKCQVPCDCIKINDIINEFLRDLLSEGSEYWENIDRSDAELLRASLQMVSDFQNLQTIISTNFCVNNTSSEQVDYEETSTSIDNGLTEDKQLIIEIGVLLASIVGSFLSPWLVLVANGAVVGNKAYNKYHKTNKRKTKINLVDDGEPVDISKTISETDIDKILSAIEGICNQVDVIINKYKNDKLSIVQMYENQIKEFRLDNKFSKILEAFQYCYKDLQNNKELYEHVVEPNLESYGYKIVEYNKENKNYFLLQTKTGATEEEMYLPAIVFCNENSNEVLVKKGLVFIP